MGDLANSARIGKLQGSRGRTLPRQEEPPIIKVQVKSNEGSIGDPVVSALYGKVSSGEFGLLVTLGTFTSAARNFARSKSNLRLIDGSELVRLVLQHYEQFDSRYKGLLPLKRVYVPEVLEAED